MSVYSFCPNQIKSDLKKIKLKNKGDKQDILEVKKLWTNWISKFSGCEKKKKWAVCNGIHDALITQIAYRSAGTRNFYRFNRDYGFYSVILEPYGGIPIDHEQISQISEMSYVVVSQPNHEGKITHWFPELVKHCKNNGSKIFLDCAFYGTTTDSLDTSDPVFDAVAFSLSKNFLLGGFRSGCVWGDDLSPTLTIPIDYQFKYNYFNSPAVELAKIILPKYHPGYITDVAKLIQTRYCLENGLTPCDIWMFALQDGKRICITDFIRDEIQHKLDEVHGLTGFGKLE